MHGKMQELGAHRNYSLDMHLTIEGQYPKHRFCPIFFFPSIIALRAYHWGIGSGVGGESAVADGLMVSNISYLLEWQATFFDDNFLGQKVHKYFLEQWEQLESHAPNTSVKDFMEPWKHQAWRFIHTWPHSRKDNITIPWDSQTAALEKNGITRQWSRSWTWSWKL